MRPAGSIGGDHFRMLHVLSKVSRLADSPVICGQG